MNDVRALITQPMVKWLMKLCSSLETLTVDRQNGTLQAGMLPQFLMVAKDATKLRLLRMKNCPIEQADICSLAFLSQLRELALLNCPFSGEGHQTYGMQCLTDLRYLRVSSFFSS